MYWDVQEEFMGKHSLGRSSIAYFQYLNYMFCKSVVLYVKQMLIS